MECEMSILLQLVLKWASCHHDTIDGHRRWCGNEMSAALSEPTRAVFNTHRLISVNPNTP